MIYMNYRVFTSVLSTPLNKKRDIKEVEVMPELKLALCATIAFLKSANTFLPYAIAMLELIYRTLE